MRLSHLALPTAFLIVSTREALAIPNSYRAKPLDDPLHSSGALSLRKSNISARAGIQHVTLKYFANYVVNIKVAGQTMKMELDTAADTSWLYTVRKPGEGMRLVDPLMKTGDYRTIEIDTRSEDEGFEDEDDNSEDEDSTTEWAEATFDLSGVATAPRFIFKPLQRAGPVVENEVTGLLGMGIPGKKPWQQPFWSRALPDQSGTKTFGVYLGASARMGADAGKLTLGGYNKECIAPDAKLDWLDVALSNTGEPLLLWALPLKGVAAVDTGGRALPTFDPGHTSPIPSMRWCHFDTGTSYSEGPRSQVLALYKHLFGVECVPSNDDGPNICTFHNPTRRPDTIEWFFENNGAKSSVQVPASSLYTQLSNGHFQSTIELGDATAKGWLFGHTILRDIYVVYQQDLQQPHKPRYRIGLAPSTPC